MFRTLILLFVLVLVSSSAYAQDTTLKLLFLGDQKNHKPIVRFKTLEPAMAQKGISLKYTESVSDLSAETLNQYDGLVLYANIDTIDPEQAKALIDD